MTVLDDLLFCHVEDIGFMRMMQKVVPSYKLKQRNFYSNMICEEMYDKVSSIVQKHVDELKESCALSFTTDAWSDSSAGHSILNK